MDALAEPLVKEAACCKMRCCGKCTVTSLLAILAVTLLQGLVPHLLGRGRQSLEVQEPAVAVAASEHGTISGWDDSRGFGFVMPAAGGEDLFVHVRTLVDGDGSVQTGDEVVFNREYNVVTGRTEAVKVRVAPRGTVVCWDKERGFGFIQPVAGGPDLFCHVASLLDGDGSVKQGDLVTYQKEYCESTRKEEATDVRIARGRQDDSRLANPEGVECDAWLREAMGG
eukprot:gnl/TRDRNA2_/TRDRNA2_129633_c0_seq2.p1 gnl/TRDRNA2_/TRDRNA2_129633_c0~~gnl/TRDRNA2_/TRDRNA2_129633_c0_seq2.p1  ORF type:complete len:226 (+),score=48.39 gnl/TRDRNA2_/TRDRNA2_129633_c0_seq2:89-766(+)